MIITEQTIRKLIGGIGWRGRWESKDSANEDEGPIHAPGAMVPRDNINSSVMVFRVKKRWDVRLAFQIPVDVRADRHS